MATLNIKILGANCNKCNTLFLRVQKIVAEHQLDAVVEKITDTQIIISHNIYITPSLIINNQVVSKGYLLNEKQIIEIINPFLPESKQITISYQSNKKAKKIVFFIGLLVILATISFLLIKNNLPDTTEKSINQSVNNKLTLADSIFLMYDYSKQNTTFKLSFLEFGSTGCRECKMMEEVMKEVKANFANRINVVFYNVTKKENKTISKYFGIQIIPVQILLDKNGKEVFRHIGYYSYNELSKEFKKLGVN